MENSMSPEHRLKIKKNYVALVNDMQTEQMFPYFIQEVSDRQALCNIVVSYINGVLRALGEELFPLN